MKLLGLVLVAACGPGIVMESPHVAGRQALLDASGNADRLVELFRGSITNGGLFFEDAACESKFAAGGDVRPDQLEQFAHCLAALHLQASPREDALGDVVVMTYAPGMEIEARVAQEDAGAHLSWIGYESRRAVDAPIATITVDALDSIRTAGDRNGPVDAGDASTLELDAKSHSAYAWLRICVDETGMLSLAHTFQSTSEKATELFENAARHWTFRPFTIDGHPVPVCSMVKMTYPPNQTTVETLPLPPPPSRSKKEPLVFAGDAKKSLIEGKRIAGNKMISPDDSTKTKIASSRVDKVVGSFRICLDDA
ncbi:MAG TPA: hypothetical protein VGM88_35335, partial [Kofleriaceae bacterium]